MGDKEDHGTLSEQIKGDAKEMTQTLFHIKTPKVKFSHFCLICQKIYTLSFLMS